MILTDYANLTGNFDPFRSIMVSYGQLWSFFFWLNLCPVLIYRSQLPLVAAPVIYLVDFRQFLVNFGRLNHLEVDLKVNFNQNLVNFDHFWSIFGQFRQIKVQFWFKVGQYR